MRALVDITLVAAFFVLLLVAPASGDGAYRSRLADLEAEFVPRYMKLAETAKRYRYADLTKTIFRHAESLDPGHDEVIDFDPAVRRPASGANGRRRAAIEAEFKATRHAEARARFEIALWCEREALTEASVDQFCAACALVPGTFSFDEQGVITSSLLGAVSKSLSLTILEDWEVFRGSVVSRKDLPESVPWKDAWRIETKHFAIVTNVSGDLCRTLGRALEAAREIYREETGYDVAARITVHVPATRKKYVGLWLEQNRPAPEPTNLGKCYRDYCAVDGSKPTREVISVALHEVAHGYLNLGLEAESGRRGTTMPPWYHEGLATYCAGYGKDSLSWRRGVVLPEIAKAAPLGAFREIVTKGEAIPLEKFLGAEPGGTAYYLQACAFFWFFHDTEDADLRARFADAVKALRKARLTEDRIERGREVFLGEIGIEAAELERRFLAWAKSLES